MAAGRWIAIERGSLEPEPIAEALPVVPVCFPLADRLPMHPTGRCESVGSLFVFRLGLRNLECEQKE